MSAVSRSLSVMVVLAFWLLPGGSAAGPIDCSSGTFDDGPRRAPACTGAVDGSVVRVPTDHTQDPSAAVTVIAFTTGEATLAVDLSTDDNDHAHNLPMSRATSFASSLLSGVTTLEFCAAADPDCSSGSNGDVFTLSGGGTDEQQRSHEESAFVFHGGPDPLAKVGLPASGSLRRQSRSAGDLVEGAPVAGQAPQPAPLMFLGAALLIGLAATAALRRMANRDYSRHIFTGSDRPRDLLAADRSSNVRRIRLSPRDSRRVVSINPRGAVKVTQHDFFAPSHRPAGQGVLPTALIGDPNVNPTVTLEVALTEADIVRITVLSDSGAKFNTLISGSGIRRAPLTIVPLLAANDS